MPTSSGGTQDFVLNGKRFTLGKATSLEVVLVDEESNREMVLTATTPAGIELTTLTHDEEGSADMTLHMRVVNMDIKESDIDG